MLAAPAFGLAAEGYVEGYVERVLIAADNRWGGCMAAISPGPQSALPGCLSSFVTFSCTGDFTDRLRAYRMVDQAQLALAAGKRVKVWFQDDKKHNGHCFANRIDVLE